MMRFLTSLFVAALFFACVGEDILDDYVQPQLQLRGIPDTLEAGTSLQLTTQFFNNIGEEENIDAVWSSADASILTVTPTGLATGVMEGTTTISATFTDPEFDETTSATALVTVGASTVVVEELESRSGTIATTSSYVLKGAFTLEEIEGGGLKLSLGEDYVADDGLPGLVVYLSNNPRSRANAFEIAPVTVFNGAHEYMISDVELEDYRYVLYFCKPFNVEVGSGEIVE